MERLLAILSDTPWWVFPLFAYGVITGVQAFRPRRVVVWALLVLPLLFLGLGLSSLIPVLATHGWVGALWLGVFVLGVALGWFFLGAEPESVEPQKHAFVSPGTWVLLVFFVMVFTVRFAFGYLSATAPQLAQEPGTLVVVFATSGAVTGLMAGRTAKLYTRYRWLVRSTP